MRLREKHSAERRAFRRHIAEIAKDLEGAPSEEAVRDTIDGRKEEIADGLKAQAATLRASRLGTTWDLFSLSVPGWVAPGLAAAGAGGIVVGIGTGIALAFGAVNWFVQRRGRARADATSTPWHYLMTLRKKVRPEISRVRLVNGLQQLVFD
jgi:hypothetical protein